jgi:hypothetical protein
MDLLLVASPCFWIQQTDQSQELSRQRFEGTQVLHRIHNVCSVVRVPAPSRPSCNASIRAMDALHTITCSYAIYW